MRYVRAHGYRCPDVHDAGDGYLVMDRLEGSNDDADGRGDCSWISMNGSTGFRLRLVSGPLRCPVIASCRATCFR